MPDHDVVIAGAGPVGLLLACLLGARGIDAVVCERRADADRRSRAIGIHRPGLDALEAAGVGASVRREALALDGGEVRSRGRVLARLDFEGERPVLVLPQERTDALLRSRLDRLRADALLRGTEVRAVRDDGEVVRIAVDTGQGRRELSARFAVVADGVRSGLRSSLGLGWKQRRGSADYAMLDVLDVLDVPDVPDVPDAAGATRAVLHCGPGGLVESFPMPGGRRRWVVRRDPLQPVDTAEAFCEAIRQRTGVRPAVPVDAVPTPFHVAQHVSSALVAGRVVLLGDAAHEISPIGGQGMNLGWSAAVHLAGALRRGLDGGHPDLRAFERAALRAAGVAQRRAAFYMAMGAPASGVAVPSRELLIQMLGSRPLRGWTSGLITMRGL